MKVLSHNDLKRLYSFFLVRERLLDISSSGFYPTSVLKAACTSCGVNYSTFRGNLNWYADHGLLILNRRKSVLKLNRIDDEYKRALDLYKRHKRTVINQQQPSIFFADLFKSKVMWGHVNLQASAIAYKLFADKGSRKKFLDTVRLSKQPIGESENKSESIFLPLSKIGKLISRSKGTAWKAIRRMNRSGIIVRRLNGWLTTPNKVLYLRKQNSYSFNLC